MAVANDMKPPVMSIAGAYLARRNRRKLLVMSNCQTFGIVNTMHGIASGVAVDGVVVNDVANNGDAYYAELMRRYDHVFTLTMLRERFDKPEYEDRVTYIPTVYFDAYHPDLIYAHHRGRSLDGPMSAYHSALTLGCFQRGLSVAATLAMFNAATYRALGYLDGWDTAKQKLAHGFRSHGFDALEHQFARWSAEGCFMLSVNHPRIRVLSSLAVEALRRIDAPFDSEGAEIADNMLNGPIFPVYPEIGEAFGVAGAYRFKPPGTNYTLDLEEFVTLSFETYRQVAQDDVSLGGGYRDKVDAVLRLLG